MGNPTSAVADTNQPNNYLMSKPEFAIPVVRLVIPGLEWDPHHPNYRPGQRARAMIGR